MIHVADVGELLQQRGESRVVVIGKLLGGLIAIYDGALNPKAMVGAGVERHQVRDRSGGRRADRGYVGKPPPVHTWEWDAAAQARLVNGAALPDYTEDD